VSALTVQAASPFDSVTQYFFEKLEFEPTKEQEAILTTKHRFVLVTGGEQAGKSMVAAKFMLSRLPDAPPQALFWLVGPDYANTEREFTYLKEDFEALGILQDSTKRNDPGQLTLDDGTRIVTKSAKDPRSLAREAPHGILACEAAQLDLPTYERMRGRTGPRRGWLMMSGTLEAGIGWYPQLATAWTNGMNDRVSYSLPTWSNHFLYPGGRNDPEIIAMERESSDDYFMERIAGHPVPPAGLVFGEFRVDIHVRDIKWVPKEPVHVWVDPGYAGAHAVVAVQVVNGQVQVFDELYEQGLTTSDMISKARRKPWWKDVRFGVIDVAGMQHQAMAAPAEVWLDEAGLYMSSQKVPINQGSERLKALLKPDSITGEPQIVFAPHLKGILSEFGVEPNPFNNQTQAYRWKLDRDGNIVGDTPEDKYNHSVKAVIYGLVDRFGYVSMRDRGERIKVRHW
jgi:hypothetical protein